MFLTSEHEYPTGKLVLEFQQVVPVEEPMYHQEVGALQQCGNHGNGIAIHTVQRNCSYLFLCHILHTLPSLFTIVTVTIQFR
jgi:hypothetical protein